MQVIVDTDLGADGCVALLWLLALDARFRADVVGITTTEGYHNRQGTFDNAAKLLELCQRRDIKITQATPHSGNDPTHFHEKDGLHGCRHLLPEARKQFDDAPLAAGQIVRWLKRDPGDLTILCLGPCTNLAAAESLEPGILKLAQQIIITAGAFQRGDVTEISEFNAHFNAPALTAVLNHSIESVLIPLDITRQLDLALESLSEMQFHESTQRINYFFYALCRAAIEHAKTTTREKRFFLHDACAVAYAYYPQYFESVEANVQIEARGKPDGIGKTSIRKDGLPNTTILRRMDGPAARQLMLADIKRFSDKLR